jgi:urea transport system permease protein
MMKKIITSVCLCLLLASSLAADVASLSKDQQFKQILSGLTAKSFNDKQQVISSLAGFDHKQSLNVLKQLLDGKMYYRKSDKQLFIIQLDGKQASIYDPLTIELIETLPKKKLKKVGINNKLRGRLKRAIAELSLSDSDPKVRKHAVSAIMSTVDEGISELIMGRLEVETEQSVRDELSAALNIYRLSSTDETEVLNAVKYLSTSLHSETRVALKELQGKTTQLPVTDSTTKLLTHIEDSLYDIQSSVNFYKQIENIFFGLSLGSVLLLAAVGLAITFGVMGVINMAHGEMLMLGAYTTYIVQLLMPDAIAYSLLVSLPVAFLFTALVGIAIERGVIRFLYGRPLETLLATFGISLILQQAVRTFISPQNRAVASPDWISGSLQINPALALTYNRLYIIIFAFMVLAGLMLLLKKTSFGLQIRAVTQNRSMAKAMGIRTDWVDAFTFGLGSGIAGMAGVALSQLTNVGPNMGQAYIIDSFMVVVFGGVGNLWGTLFGAMSLGIANKYIEPLTGAVLAKVLVLVFIILFIQKKPSGMFALKGRSAD